MNTTIKLAETYDRKEIPSFPGYYITRSGYVYSTRGNEIKRLKPSKQGSGIPYWGYSLMNPQGKKQQAYLHRLIAEAFVPNPNSVNVVDHIDGNRLNNHPKNLRWTTPRGNQANRVDRREGRTRSPFPGVTWSKRMNKWHARFAYNRKTVHLGYFFSEAEASLAYDRYLADHISNGGI